MSHPNRRYPKTTFNRNALLYDRARPRYPEKLFEDLVVLADLGNNSLLLEIGCGTGQATLPMAERGYRIVCVELGDDLARLARRKLARFPAVRVINAAFEDWDPGGARFDLVYAAQAWHWLDPEISYHKAAQVLEPGGFLAIIDGEHAFPQNADRFFFDIQDVYKAIGEDIDDEPWPPPLPEDVPDMRDEVDATGLFGDFQSRRYVWELSYTADQYVDLLNSFSGHIAMETEKRQFLYRNIRERIAARADARVRRHWLAILNVARRRG